MATWSFPNALYSGIDKEEEGMSYQVFSHETYILLSSPFIIILTKISIDFQFHYCDIKTTANILHVYFIYFSFIKTYHKAKMTITPEMLGHL